MKNIDEKYMEIALEEAKKAENIKEVPIGAIIVYNDKIIGRGYNQREILNDPTAHSEIIAIKEASKYLNSWRLTGATLYVTIEPCPMCAGAILNSRINRIVIGARDKKAGACGSVINILEKDKFNHNVEIEFGVLEEESSNIISNFFKKLREERKDKK